VGAGLVVEGWFVVALSAACDRHLDALREVLPSFVVEAEGAILGGLARPRAAKVASGIGERRPRTQPVAASAHRIEDVQQRVEVAHSSRHLRRVAEGQLEEATGKPKSAPGEVAGKLFAVAEISKRSEINARVASLGDVVEHRRAFGY